MALITYENKVKINDSSLPAVNKVRDVDMNEIKNVVNTNATKLDNAIDIKTNEVVIGEDENGNTLYKNVLIYQVTGNTSTDISDLNINVLYDYNSLCRRYGNTNEDYEKPYYNSSTDYFRSFIRINTNTIETRITTSSAYSTYEIRTTLIYTKNN